jgi:hypothetical protein
VFREYPQSKVRKETCFRNFMMYIVMWATFWHLICNFFFLCILYTVGCVYRSIKSLGARENGRLESQDRAKAGEKVSYSKRWVKS